MIFNIFKIHQSYDVSRALKAKKKKLNDKEPADFETAIAAAGFGHFNILLLLAICPGAMATAIEVSVISYVLPSAECDLKLDLVDKGILNAIAFAGMIVSSAAWGFLADSKGRKKLLIWGFLFDVLCTLATAASQSFIQLMISKFFGGFVMSGPFAILMSYLSEFHSTQYRERIIMLVGIMFSVSSLLLPIVAMAVLPLDWNFDFLTLQFTSWKIYLALFGIPSLLSGVLLCFFPESPRFTMSKGRIAETMETFQTIYSMNTGKPKNTYPIKELINEKANKKQKKISVATIENILKERTDNVRHMEMKVELGDQTTQQPSGFKTLFVKPYLRLSLIVYLLNFLILFGQITLRLWLPQLFASLYEYEQISTGTISMCSILEYSVNKTALVKDEEETCSVVITPSTYTNNIIVAVVNLIGFFLAGTLVNYLGQQRIQIICLSIAGTLAVALYWSSSALSTLIITTVYITMAMIATVSTIGTSVNLFPTSLRTLIVSLSWMFGRCGCILGNILFPIAMSMGCIPPFLMIATSMFLACILSASLPSTKKMDLK